MNIFVLSECPVQSAEFHNDTHVNKMLLESCQLLCNVFYSNSSIENIPYRKSQFNHPCAVWARKSKGNFEWLLSLAIELNNQFYLRRKKIHGCAKILDWIILNKEYLLFEFEHRTEFVLGFNKEVYSDCIVDGDIIKSYQNYYRLHKQFYLKGGKRVYYEWSLVGKPYFM